MTAGRILAAIVAVIMALVAIGFLVSGAAVLWAYSTQRDDAGFLTSPTFDLETDGYALTSTEIDLASRPGDWWPSDLADAKFTVTPATSTPVFVGIGPSDDVEAYLSGVGYDEVTRLGPNDDDVNYRSVDGGAPATAPEDQEFWVESTSGTGTLTLIWDVAQGEWSVVVMNDNGSSGVAVDLEAGAKVDILPAVAVGLLIAGFIIGAIAAALLVWAVRPQPVAGEPAAAPPVRTAAGAYPVTVEGVLDPALTRWMWLIKWILAIPHYIILGILWAIFVVLTVVAFFSIAFTGRYPRGIFDFNVGVMRWSWRVSFYTFSALGTDQYPPFTLADADYPARFDVEYPERLSRGLVWVKWWLLAIPHYIIVGLFTSGLIWWTTDLGDGDAVLEAGGGLISLLVFIAALALLFTGRYPQGLFDLVMGLNRWAFRVGAYATLMRDEYPPFRLDMGGLESDGGRAQPPHTPSPSEQDIYNVE